MKTKDKKFVTNDRGEKVGVILDIKVFEEMMEAIEELESIRAYDSAMSSVEETIPFEKAIDEIEKNHK